MLPNIPPMLDVHFGVPMLGAMLNTINTRLDARTIAYILGQGSTDIIISGGENLSSLAVEAALVRHPSVALAAVVARPDEKWGETPCAFVELRSGASAAGKIQTYELRQRARDL